MGPTATAIIEDVATQQRRRFDGHNCRVRGSGTVHATGYQRWLGDEEVAVPVCGVGVSGFDPGALSPTDDPVTCRRTGCTNAPPRGARQPPLWD